MNTTRLEIKRIEAQILALEAEAAALLDREKNSDVQPKQITFVRQTKRNLKASNLKKPAQLH